MPGDGHALEGFLVIASWQGDGPAWQGDGPVVLGIEHPLCGEWVGTSLKGGSPLACLVALAREHECYGNERPGQGRAGEDRGAGLPADGELAMLDEIGGL